MADQNSPSHQFFDALDEFPPSDRGQAESQLDQTAENSQVSQLDSIPENDEIKSPHSPESSTPDPLRQRSSLRFRRRESSNDDSKDSTDSSPVSEIFHACEERTPRERRSKFLSALKDHENLKSRPESPRFRSNSGRVSTKHSRNCENSGVSDSLNEQTERSETAESLAGDADPSPSSFLVSLASLIIKAIVFQIGLLIRFITFPIWLVHWSLMLVTNPFRTLKSAKDRVYEKFSRILSYLFATICPTIYEQLRNQQSIGKYLMKFGWGFFWSFYVCIVLIGILVMAFVTSGIVMKWLAEEPLRMKETLNFDYTKANPVALVPILSCDGISASKGLREKIDVGNFAGSRVIPPNHKLQVIVALTLPESDYNRRLGVFQVRIDFVSTKGKATASSSHPCMLRFKSMPIRYVETFLKSVPLLAGYSSEAQTRHLRMTGFTEGMEPTACLRVVLEKRAEFRPGAGIPEIYSATLVLESELPLIKRIIWNWKMTIFIWLGMWVFVMEVLLILLCCRPIIIPMARHRDVAGNTTTRRPNSDSVE